MYKSGLRELELHYSPRPKWYFKRAEKILTAVVESYINLYGAKRFLRNLASPVFFDALSVTSFLDELKGGATTIMATILKNTLKPEIGLAIVGGKRVEGYRVPVELDKIAEVFTFSQEILDYLKYASRMVAKVDNVAIQDGFPLYFHMMIISEDGEWTVIQQGIRSLEGLVRRYHWSSTKVKSFVEEPHTGIISTQREKVVIDMTSIKSRESREVCVELVTCDFKRLRKTYEAHSNGGQITLTNLEDVEGEVKLEVPRIKWAIIQSLSQVQPKNFEELLAWRGIGLQTLRFLVIASIELYRVYPSFKDPAVSFEEAYKSMENLNDKCIYEVMDAVKESSLEIFLKKVCCNRLDELLSMLEANS
ncbi:MAG: DUF763 domain-containing protein [Nitrososphaeria archaeon]|nr:DUF763 domain-containing protein [Nitrososphaeria archaeon]